MTTTAQKHKFPMARTCPFAPPPAYEESRRHLPRSPADKRQCRSHWPPSKASISDR